MHFHAKNLCVTATSSFEAQGGSFIRLDSVPYTLRTQSVDLIGCSRALLGLRVSEHFFFFPEGSDIL